MNDSKNSNADTSDPLDALEEMLDAGEFDPPAEQRISVVLQHPPTVPALEAGRAQEAASGERPAFKPPSYLTELSKKNKKLATVITVVFGLVAWIRVGIEIWQSFH